MTSLVCYRSSRGAVDQVTLTPIAYDATATLGYVFANHPTSAAPVSAEGYFAIQGGVVKDILSAARTADGHLVLTIDTASNAEMSIVNPPFDAALAFPEGVVMGMSYTYVEENV